MAEERIKIYLDGDSRGLINATGQAESSISKLFKIIGVASLAGGAIMLARKGFQTLEKGIQLFISTIKESIEEAANAEVQLTKLNTSLKSTGNFTQETSDELVKYAEALQRVTEYEDDSVVAVEAMLATFKLNKDEIKIATQAVLDLAAATGQDLQSAAILLGKAMVGETGMLKRYGIMVDENKYKAEGWKAVIDEINVEFGGQALAKGQTYTGMLERMKNITGDLKETIGAVFLPVFKDLMDRFSTGTPIVDEFGNAIGNTTSPLERLQEFVSNAAIKIKELLDALIQADWTPVIIGLNSVATSIGILVSGRSSVETLDEKVQNFVNTLGELLFKISQLISAIKVLFDVIIIIIRTVESFAFEIIKINFLITSLGIALIDGTNLHEKYNIIVNKSTEFNTLLGKSLENVDSDIRKITAAYVPATTNQNTFTDSVNKSIVFLNNASSAARDLANSIHAIPSSKTITIQTIYESITRGIQNPMGAGRQSGGLIGSSQFASDLNIPLFKGEAVLPAALVRAIKENRGSFAGINTQGGGNVQNYFNVSELVVREEADIYKIAQELYSLQVSSLRGVGIR